MNTHDSFLQDAAKIGFAGYAVKEMAQGKPSKDFRKDSFASSATSMGASFVGWCLFWKVVYTFVIFPYLVLTALICFVPFEIYLFETTGQPLMGHWWIIGGPLLALSFAIWFAFPIRWLVKKMRAFFRWSNRNSTYKKREKVGTTEVMPMKPVSPRGR